MIFKKGSMWKIAGSAAKYSTEEEAKAAAGIKQTVIKEAPFEKRATCNECACDPCECEAEWKSVEKTSTKKV